MADFTAEVFQNEFLPDGGTDVHAIVRITSSGASAATSMGVVDPGSAAEVILIDTSGSMGRRGVMEAGHAAKAALNEIVDGTLFAVVSGNGTAQIVYPYAHQGALAVMSSHTRAEARRAVEGLRAQGGTAMGTWLTLARQIFETVPHVQKRHAILLTDGVNEGETPASLQAAVQSCVGVFQCDARGVGDQWRVEEVRAIASALLGTVGLVPEPEELAAEFQAMMRASMSRGVASAELRVWVPQGAELLFVRQVSPTLEDLTGRRSQVNPLTGAYPTGAWSDESRDYHVAVRLPARTLGQEQLAARVSLGLGDQPVCQGLVKARWSNDDALTTRIDPAVAAYTGQAELAQVIQEGLAAKASGHDEVATAKLGRAVQLAGQTGNDEMTTRLKKVVEIDDADTGTVRLKKSVSKLDEMSLDTASTKTSRVRR
ncbi:VWA domain-containing protein [Intrasporangium calvum]|uniref:von Willebrand factor type A n=1 Tax=Intrasporangium calvum (strain ATCC 23552 / DSM 43043 / JCM 3097 / NBRC 12989 / NCIMB 10167 / NRRL B-3866 / 7 KIP) TaxID=710696 RepID=E6S9B2_INTC7|nr:VWA domain-containing protein [Intrasporangium calvum]ADU47088.1 von Willebrand factor type A [Intrasporangium calvum DSM 43043]